MSDNWVVQNLERALNTWNEKLAEIWQLVTQSPETFNSLGDFSKPVQMFSSTVMVGEDSFRTIRLKYRGLTPHFSAADL